MIPAVKTELSLFDAHVEQRSAERGVWVDFHPTSSNYNEGPIEFFIHGNSEYIDPNDTMLCIKTKIVKSDGKSSVARTDMQKISPVNLLHSSLFSDAQLYLNDVQIEGGSNLYNYKCIINALTQFHPQMLTSQLYAAGYAEDAATRTAWFQNNEECEFAGPLQFDLFNQSRYILPNVDMRI